VRAKVYDASCAPSKLPCSCRVSLRSSESTISYSFCGLRIDATSELGCRCFCDPLAATLSGIPKVDELGNADVRMALKVGIPEPLANLGRERARVFFVGPFNAHVTDDASGSRDSSGLVLRAPGATIRIASSDGSVVAVATREMLERDAEAMERALFVALAIALRAHGRFHLHAGAVALENGRTVLILGASGAGKTTTTLALAAAGANPLGDDTLFVWRSPTGLRLASLRGRFHVGSHTQGIFPSFAPFLGEPLAPGSDKRSLDAARAFAERMLTDMAAPSVILCPVVRATEATRIERADRVRATSALIESSALIAVPGVTRTQEQWHMLEELLDAAKVYAVTLGIGELDARSIGAL
jgi:hypothetical protein